MAKKLIDIKAEGEISGMFSPSMGVNTKPAHKLEIAGYWVLIDPNMPRAMIEKLKIAVMIHDVEIIENER